MKKFIQNIKEFSEKGLEVSFDGDGDGIPALELAIHPAEGAQEVFKKIVGFQEIFNKETEILKIKFDEKTKILRIYTDADNDDKPSFDLKLNLKELGDATIGKFSKGE